MVRTSTRAAPLLALCLPLLSCGGGDEPPTEPSEPERRVTGVRVTPSSATLRAIGASQDFEATVTDQDGAVMSGVELTWSVGDTAVATVDGGGTVTARASGATDVTARASGVSGSASVGVEPAVGRVSIAADDSTLTAIEDTLAYRVAVEDTAGNELRRPRLACSSSDPGVATVTTGTEGAPRCVAVAAGAGRAHVRAEAGGIRDSASLRVDQEVASLGLSPDSAELRTVGDTARFSATPRDANGYEVSDAELAWTSADTAVATVTDAGLVTAWKEGSAHVTAAAGGRADTARIGMTVEPVRVEAVAGDTLPEAGEATLSGSGFSPTAGVNAVLVDGRAAEVVASGFEELTVRVPDFDCRPQRSVSIEVDVGGASDDARSAPLRPDEASVDLETGGRTLVRDPGEFCLQFAAGADSSVYLVGVQNTSEVPSTLTPVEVTARAAGPDGGGDVRLEPGARGRAADGDPGPPAGARVPERRRKHAAAESRLQTRSRELLDARRASFIPPRPAADAALQSSVDSGVSRGDTVTVRVPDAGSSDVCADYTEIDAAVRLVGHHGVWLEDLANPEPGYADADLEELNRRFDDAYYPVATDYFGTPGDRDGNGRVAIVASTLVNATDAIAFVAPGDLFSRAECAASDGGEITYVRAPDPDGAHGPEYPADTAVADMVTTIPHEFVHMIQNNQRLSNDAPFPSVWVSEGQATLAEEVVGHRVTGRRPGMNYGLEVAFGQSDEHQWYLQSFSDMAWYFGWFSQSIRVSRAPHECTWLDDDVSTPCFGSRPVYGTPWSFLRWLSDHFGPERPGGEQALQRELTSNDATGFANVSDVVGEPIEPLLADWAASLYADDRIDGLAERLTIPSWDLRDIYQRGYYENARLQPVQLDFASSSTSLEVRAGSSAYLRLSGVDPAATALRIAGSSGSPLPDEMQVWVVRLR